MENQQENGSKEPDGRKRGLSLDNHLFAVIYYFFIFGTFTGFVFIVDQYMNPVGLSQDTIRWALLTGIEIILVLGIQAILDKKARKDNRSLSFLIQKRWRDFGFRKKTSARTMAIDALIILFCILVPLDLISYVIPGSLAYVAGTRVGSRFDGVPLGIMLTVGIIYNLLTGLKEEFVFRGYLAKRLHEDGKRYSSWFIVSIFFGLLHFDPTVQGSFGPVVWLATATLVGFLFSGYSLSTKQILPLIVAHGFGNFISSVSIWMYHVTGGFSTMPMGQFLLAYYGPMILAGIIFTILFRGRIKEGFRALKILVKESRREFVSSDIGIIVIMIIILFFSVFLGLQI